MRALLGRIAVWWALLGGVLLFAIVFVTVTNVGGFALDRVARLFGGTVYGLPGYEDFVRLAISAAALMLLPYCQLVRGHLYPRCSRPCPVGRGQLERADRSPGVRRMTFPITRRIYVRSVRVASDFASLCPLVRRTSASYAVRVPRVIVLPAASFPRRLATTQLQFS